MTTPEQVFQRYEEVKPRLPQFMPGHAGSSRVAESVQNLGEIDDRFDVFLFDAFGVLNVGESVLEEAPLRLESLQAKNKLIYILTNSASHQKQAQIDKFQRFGFSVADENIVSSREVLLKCLGEKGTFRDGTIRSFGVITICDLSDWPEGINHVCFDYEEGADNQAFWDTDAIIFMSSGKWNDTFQKQLIAHLKEHPKPVYIGNPDIVAPREDRLSLEPGYFAHQIMDETDATVEFFGKPFGNAFDLAIERAREQRPDLDLSRVLMVGDTLHTDILGGKAAGVATALVTNYGTYKGKELAPYLTQSGIVPDYIMPTI